MKIKDIKYCAFSSGDCDCYDDCNCWECTSDSIKELLGLAEKDNRVIAVVTATKLDWLNRSGSKIINLEKINKPADFFHAIVGGDYDCTVTQFKAIKNGFSVRVSSHDVPTGGSRVVTFLTLREFYKANKAEIYKNYSYDVQPTFNYLSNYYSVQDIIDLI